MNADPDCIFCKIANHEIPATVVYEDDQVIAFDDLSPQAPVHTLVVPKEHYRDITDGVPAEVLASMTHAIDEVAQAKGLGEGFRIISNKGAHAGQTVMHLHVHVLGGKPLGEGLL
ncbi:histidine triad nucleotide-binding protein [Collinsella vaginalis]|uniref:histidine triad nucleotide-binding protein n=1 Tax=Collinsella vaginalis TaxID=1870987 RepID=UPI000A26E08A|nr:histidine triad nucleotide-binding protein [Collinsella vaginalis]